MGHDTSKAFKGTSLFIAKCWEARAPSTPPPKFLRLWTVNLINSLCRMSKSNIASTCKKQESSIRDWDIIVVVEDLIVNFLCFLGVWGPVLADKTVCMSAKHHDGKVEYDMHSLFGWSQTEPTYE